MPGCSEAFHQAAANLPLRLPAEPIGSGELPAVEWLTREGLAWCLRAARPVHFSPAQAHFSPAQVHFSRALSPAHFSRAHFSRARARFSHAAALRAGRLAASAEPAGAVPPGLRAGAAPRLAGLSDGVVAVAVPDGAAARRREAPAAAEGLRVVPDAAEGLRVVRPSAELPLALPSAAAWTFRRGQPLPWPGPSPSARFAHGTAGFRIALP